MIYKLEEERQGWKINSYIVDVTEEMKKQALDFADTIVKTNNQYSRLLPEHIREQQKIEIEQKIEIQRNFVGKLGEVAFLKLLESFAKNVNTDKMFEVFEGQTNVDNFDFVTLKGKTVDVKTGYRDCHKRLLVNKEQFENIPKDYYVGVKLNAVDVDKCNKLVDLNSITKAKIEGYVEYRFLANQEYIDFGEGPAKPIFYNQLMGINKLLKEF